MRSLPFLHVCIYYFIMSIKSHYISYWLFLPTIRESAILEEQCYATSAFLETLYVSTDTIFVHFLFPYSNHITFYSFLCLYIAVCTLSCWHFRIMTLFVVFVCALSFFLSFLCNLELLFFPYYMFNEHKLVFDGYKSTPKPFFYLIRYLCCISDFFKLCHQQNNSFGYIRCTCFSYNGQILFCKLQTVKTIDYG